MHRLVFTAVAAACAWLVTHQAFAVERDEVRVRTVPELVNALAHAAGAQRIRLRAGRYTLSAPLHVPDGVELVGEGVMRVDPDGLPVGFQPGTETVLAASDRLEGDVVRLSDGTMLRGLRIEGPAPDPAQGDVAAGNIVVIASRRPGDRLHASLRDCEVVNHGTYGYADGPTGRAVVVMTVNPGGVGWHEGAQVSITIGRSVVRNTAESNSVFAINFAGGGTLELDVERNRFEGSFGMTGGAGRPNRVHGASATLRSRGNLYVGDGDAGQIGWQLIGGSVSPHHPRTEGAESNTIRVDSRDDRIEGYHIGVQAAAGRPIAGVPGAVMNNRAELLLGGLRIKTIGERAADLSLHGALLSIPSGASAAAVERVDGNVLQVNLQRSTGSGPRSNVYANRSPPEFAAAGAARHSDRLEFTGSRARFLDSNAGFDPAPGPGFFRTE